MLLLRTITPYTILWKAASATCLPVYENSQTDTRCIVVPLYGAFCAGTTVYPAQSALDGNLVFHWKKIPRRSQRYCRPQQPHIRNYFKRTNSAYSDPEQQAVTQPIPRDTVPDPELLQPETEKMIPCRDFVRPRDYNPVLSVILPFEEPEKNAGFTEFYQGMLLAVEKMKDRGMQAVVQVFDWNKTPADELLSLEALGRSHVIIGPVYSGDIGSTLAYFRNSHTKVVSPLDSKSDVWVSSFPNFFQVQPGLEVQQEALLKYLDPHHAALWVISEEGEQVVAPGIRKMLDKNLIPYKNFSYDVLRGREVTGKLEKLLEVNPRTRLSLLRKTKLCIRCHPQFTLVAGIRKRTC